MTTRIVVHADHGWPVRVTTIALAHVGTAETVLSETVVPPGSSMDFHVWDGADLRIHEIQPAERAVAAK